MYFVDREHIEATLQHLENQLSLFENEKKWDTDLKKAALERLLQTAIDSILDTGNAMIDGFIMRDPGSYDDIIDILVDEKVIVGENGERLKKVISYRKMLVQQYINVDHEQLFAVFAEHLTALKQFAPSVRAYLTNELGPVSAFRN
ncbi:type VII toxin-antitoxin system HepT family RNase toxin [Siminovitchia sp. 179-K 8D1 HS]|uniref:type VII toxin-antitoxin system HepT family RNase toxin n=1 Tax=Siminovitchia sp. 179-K 8D1 HS TaxID=3142385 RepID=UPI0039A2C019